MTHPFDARLAEPLAAFDLPTRMRNWAGREGIETVGALVRRSPDELLRERNLGRTSVSQTRTLLEAHLGMPWEAALAQADGSPWRTPR